MDVLNKQFNVFEAEFLDLQKKHLNYLKTIDDMKEKQSVCVKSTKHEKNYAKALRKEIKELQKKATPDEAVRLNRMIAEIDRKEFIMRDMDDTLPKSNGIYLSIVLGQVDISFTNKQDKFLYKHDYERFKIIVSGISATLAFLLYFFIRSRVMDAVFHFLLVWFYCTLTIRERILIANGSRIKGWWNIYHFISTLATGIMLIWPRSQSYEEFRDQFMLFSLYLNIVHCVQYHYQKGSLYKLRALGQRHSMDITVDGFTSWMFRQLTFTLPFLFGAYFFQFYNAYSLYHISRQPYCAEWQVPVVALIFLLLATGNLVTTGSVIWQKFFAAQPHGLHQHLRDKYSFSPGKAVYEAGGDASGGGSISSGNRSSSAVCLNTRKGD